MAQGTYSDHWVPTARSRAEDGFLDEMVKSELFDHTWIAGVRQLEKQLQLTDDKIVFDAGCGWGRLMLGVKYFHPRIRIDGVELTQEFTDKAKALLELHALSVNTSVRQGDLFEVDLPDDHYDALYSSRVVHYVDDKERLLRRFLATLRPGGRAMIIIPNADSPVQRRKYRHAPLFPIRALGRIMESVGFRDLRYGGYRMLPAGLSLSHDSLGGRLEVALGNTPLGRYGGLAFAVGQK